MPEFKELIMEEFLKLQNINKTYKKGNDKIMAVNNISFSIGAGEIVGLLGPNGSGKTTIVKMICGLVKPDSGIIEILGYNPWKSRSKALSQISAVLEGSRNVYWPLTVYENLEFFSKIHPVSNVDPLLKSKIYNTIDLLGLTDQINVKAGELSRGMQQKLSIGISLVRGVPFIIFDEPTLGLDVESVIDIKKTIKNIVNELDKSILITTHDMKLVEDTCSRSIIIKDGAMITDSNVNELLDILNKKVLKVCVDKIPPNLRTIDNDNHNISIDIINNEITVFYENTEDIYRIITKLRDSNITIDSMATVKNSFENIYLELMGGKNL